MAVDKECGIRNKVTEIKQEEVYVVVRKVR